MYRSLKESKKASGFTIIEVMIVLAIAGLIMAIVFLAIPALQRNNRNTQRTADASRVLAAVAECLGNKNGQATACQSTATTSVGAYYTQASNQQLTTVNITAAAPGVPADTNTLNIGYNAKCTTAGDDLDGDGVTSVRQYAGLYLAETQNGGTTTRCIGG